LKNHFDSDWFKICRVLSSLLKINSRWGSTFRSKVWAVSSFMKKSKLWQNGRTPYRMFFHIRFYHYHAYMDFFLFYFHGSFYISLLPQAPLFFQRILYIRITLGIFIKSKLLWLVFDVLFLLGYIRWLT